MSQFDENTRGASPSPAMHHSASERITSGDRLNQTPVGLNEKQLAAIELLASGRSYVAAGKSIGVDRTTIYRWRQEAEFQKRLQARVQELWGEANERLKSMVRPSLEVVAEHLEERYDRARWRAADLVLRL